MKTTTTLIGAFLLLALVLLASGCPRIARIVLYNNAGADLSISACGERHGPFSSRDTTCFSFGCRKLEVRSASNLWTYDCPIPHGGANGPYFDGILRLQVDADGKIFALEREQSAPVRDPQKQPDGFPLEPREAKN